MVKVILADNENLEVEALKIIINNKFKNVKVVGIANYGDEVLDMVENLNPDIIFIDALLPILNGYEVCKIIKKKDKDKKIILMSIYDDFELVRQALKLKVDDYLLKPIKADKVIESINDIIGTSEDYSIDNEIKFVLNYIENNINSNIMLQDIASCMKLSISYLSKAFKNTMGTNFNKYVTNRKIEEAKKILKNTNTSISDITFYIGYNEPNYFCKVFKKVEGMTPLEYREKYNNK